MRTIDIAGFLTAGLVVLNLFFCPAARGTEPVKCIPTYSLFKENLAFQDGERLTFTVHYKWGIINSDVGKGYFRIDSTQYKGQPVFHCSAGGRSAQFYDVFFKVREDFQSWMTMDGLKPLKFFRNTYEGGYTAQNTYSFDWTPGREQIHAAIITSKRGSYSKRIPLDDCTLDLPSLICVMRNIDLMQVQQEVRYPMTLAVNDSSFSLHFTYLGQETKKAGPGRIRCKKFAVQVVAGEVFSGEADMYLWLSDDENRLPVWFKAPIRVGEVQGRLTGYSGLKHPFNSLVK